MSLAAADISCRLAGSGVTLPADHSFKPTPSARLDSRCQVEMRKKLSCFAAVFLLSAGCSGEEEPFTAARAEKWRSDIALALPPGSTPDAANAFFEGRGLKSGFVVAERVLYAPENIEPEPKSLLPFGLVRSFDIRCRFTSQMLLEACTVEPSEHRGSAPGDPD